MTSTFTLNNDLSPTTQSVTAEKSNLATKLAKSLATGTNQLSSAVDQFIGLSLKDLETIFKGFKGGIPYTMGIVDTAISTLGNVSNSLGSMLDIISTAGKATGEKLDVLDKQLFRLKGQVEGLIQRSKFDNKAVLGGQATNVDVTIGLSTLEDNVTITINDLTRLWRTGASNALNDYFSKFGAKSYTDEKLLASDAAHGENFTQFARSSYNGTKTITNSELSKGIISTRKNNNSYTRLTQQSDIYLPKLNQEMAAIHLSKANATSAASLSTMVVALASVAADANTATIGTDFNTALQTAFNANDSLSDATRDIFTAANGAASANSNLIGTDVAATFLGFQSGRTGVIDDNFTTAVSNLFEKGTAIAADANTAAISATIAATITTGISNGDDEATITASIETVLDSVALGTPANLAAIKTEADAIAGSLMKAYKVGTGEPIEAKYTLLNISENDLTTALSDNAAKDEFLDNLTDITNFNLLTKHGQAEASDIVQATLNKVRVNEAELKNQKENLEQAEEELFSQVVLLGKSSNTFLKTDYTEASIAYSKALREIRAAISALQAMNKVPEAAQRLVDDIVR